MNRAMPSPALNKSSWANRIKLSHGQKRLGSRNGRTSLGSSDHTCCKPDWGSNCRRLFSTRAEYRMVTSPGKGSPDTPVSVWRCIGKKFRRRLNVQGFGQDELIARPRGFQIRDHLGVTEKIVDKFGFNRELHCVL